MNTMQDICVFCGESAGVDRITADGGWACGECSGYECDECHQNIYVDTEVRVEYEDEDGEFHYGNYHEDCYNEQKHGKTEQ